MKKFFSNIKTNIINSIKSITLLRLISYIAVLVFSAIFFYFGSNIEYATNNGYQELHSSALQIEYTKVKVIDTVDEWIIYNTDEEGNYTKEITEHGFVYYCKVLDGDKKGEHVYVVQRITMMDCVILKRIVNGSNIYVREVSSIETMFENHPESEFINDIDFVFYASAYTIDRYPTIIVLTVIFILMLLCFSRIKGFHTLLSLGLAIASIIIVYIPAVLSGANIYFWTIVICIYSIIETLILLEGITKKSITAIVGCLSGILVCAIVCVIANATMNITGKADDINSEQYWISSTYWETFSHIASLDLRGIIFSSVLFGALGAVMDVSMSLASSLLEVYNNSEKHSLARTIKSGFNIGRDMLGTMSNTLVLAYLSTSMMTILYYVSHFYVESIFRKEFFALAITQALIGCIGILITIPLTSLICALLYNKKSEWFSKETIEENLLIEE